MNQVNVPLKLKIQHLSRLCKCCHNKNTIYYQAGVSMLHWSGRPSLADKMKWSRNYLQAILARSKNSLESCNFWSNKHARTHKKINYTSPDTKLSLHVQETSKFPPNFRRSARRFKWSGECGRQGLSIFPPSFAPLVFQCRQMELNNSAQTCMT